MLKQIVARIPGQGKTIKAIAIEATAYLEYLGFSKEPVIQTESDSAFYHSIILRDKIENVLIEYKADKEGECIKFSFSPMNVSLVYDVLLMRIRQVSRLQQEEVEIERK